MVEAMNFICIPNLPSEAIEWEVGIPIYKVEPWTWRGNPMGTRLWYAEDGTFDPMKDGLIERMADGSFFIRKHY